MLSVRLLLHFLVQSVMQQCLQTLQSGTITLKSERGREKNRRWDGPSWDFHRWRLHTQRSMTHVGKVKIQRAKSVVSEDYLNKWRKAQTPRLHLLEEEGKSWECSFQLAKSTRSQWFFVLFWEVILSKL